MKTFFDRNLNNTGRWLRGLCAAGLLLGAGLALNVSVWLALILAASGVFMLYEALRGWCVLRACGIKTRF